MSSGRVSARVAVIGIPMPASPRPETNAIGSSRRKEGLPSTAMNAARLSTDASAHGALEWRSSRLAMTRLDTTVPSPATASTMPYTPPGRPN